MSSKRYPEEFKIEAVKQMMERGYPVAKVVSRLGVSIHSAYALEQGVWCIDRDSAGKAKPVGRDSKAKG